MYSRMEVVTLLQIPQRTCVLWEYAINSAFFKTKMYLLVCQRRFSIQLFDEACSQVDINWYWYNYIEVGQITKGLLL